MTARGGHAVRLCRPGAIAAAMFFEHLADASVAALMRLCGGDRWLPFDRREKGKCRFKTTNYSSNGNFL